MPTTPVLSMGLAQYLSACLAASAPAPSAACSACLAALPELPSTLPLAALTRPSAMCTEGAGERRSGGTLATMDGAGDRRRARLPFADAAGERLQARNLQRAAAGRRRARGAGGCLHSEVACRRWGSNEFAEPGVGLDCVGGGLSKQHCSCLSWKL